MICLRLAVAADNQSTSRLGYDLLPLLPAPACEPNTRGASQCITKAPGRRVGVLGGNLPGLSSSPSTPGTRSACYNFPSTPPSWFAVSRARGEISGSLLKHQLIKRVGDNRRTREVVIGRRVCQGRLCKILY